MALSLDIHGFAICSLIIFKFSFNENSHPINVNLDLPYAMRGGGGLGAAGLINLFAH